MASLTLYLARLRCRNMIWPVSGWRWPIVFAQKSSGVSPSALPTPARCQLSLLTSCLAPMGALLTMVYGVSVTRKPKLNACLSCAIR